MTFKLPITITLVLRTAKNKGLDIGTTRNAQIFRDAFRAIEDQSREIQRLEALLETKKETL